MKSQVPFKPRLMPLLAALLLLPLSAIADSGMEPLTLDRIAEHNHRDSCWLVIEGKVYDVTPWIPEHPAPPAVILPWCGEEDATEGMRTKGYGRDHSDEAWQRLDVYKIGVIVEE